MAFGSEPLGVGVFGVDTPEAEGPPRDVFYPAAMQFDGRTRDYLTDATGLYLETTPAAQKVALRMMVRLGAIASAPTLGNDLHTISPRARDTQTRVENSVRRALADVVASGEVTIYKITHEVPNGSALLVAVDYLDNTVSTTDPRHRQTARNGA